MHRSLASEAALGLYYLALGTWFGSTLMMAFAAGNTFRAAREIGATAERLPAAATEPARFVAGEMVNGAFGWMSVIHIACAVVVILCVVLQLTVWRRGDRSRGVANGVRLALIAAAVAVLCVDLLWLRPSLGSLRATRYDEQVTSADRDRARQAFDARHRTSERMLSAAALAIAVATVVSPLALGGATRRDSGGAQDG